LGGARSKLGGARSKQHPMAGNTLCTMHKDELMHNNFAPSLVTAIYYQSTKMV
jgi:hypothetical protein